MKIDKKLMNKPFVGKSGIIAQVIKDSFCPVTGQRITTLQLKLHRMILSEFNTHRMFSRNASSSRAIPVEKLCEQVKTNPAMPVYWGANQAGMQAREECDNYIKTNIDTEYDRFEDFSREDFWKYVSSESATKALEMANAGYHKQLPNRLTEFAQWANVVVTATEWDNFFELRLHPDAQPEIHELAKVMKLAMDDSTPLHLSPGQWHLPYLKAGDVQTYINRCDNEIEDSVDISWDKETIACMISAARCARVSYKNHDNSDPDVLRDMKLADTLLKSKHMSPFEHQAKRIYVNEDILEKPIGSMGFLRFKNGVTHIDQDMNFWSANFKGFIQYRRTL